MKHKKLFTFFIFSLLSLFFTYGFFSFIAWDFNIKSWGALIRSMFGIVNLPILIILGKILYEEL